MKRRNTHQQLPRDLQKREELRKKGQFWTPEWVAEAMVAYVLQGGATHIFDPAVGAGAFFLAAKRRAFQMNRTIRLLGTELHPDVLNEIQGHGLSSEDLEHVRIADFIMQPPVESFDAIVANPPYIRHHRLCESVKLYLKRFSKEILGQSLDGRTGYHVYFLIRALKLLNPHGRLSFILPADTCEGIFAGALWQWIARTYKLDAVVTFASDATPFPGVDTNPVILMLRNEPPCDKFLWAKCEGADTDDLKRWCLSDFNVEGLLNLRVISRGIEEGIRTGLSRYPVDQFHYGQPLVDFASVMRGIATGANDFFLVTLDKAKQLKIPTKYFVRAVARTRDIADDTITENDLNELDRKGRPTYLLYLDRINCDRLPGPLRAYLESGEDQDFHNRPLISMRRPWYKMEQRTPPPILFAYLGRRNARFIRNLAKVVPLTGFLCVYPYQDDAAYIEKLWFVLRQKETLTNLPLVAKSYGQGALKVEPRGLERLPLPQILLSEAGLHAPVRRNEPRQLPLFPQAISI